MLNGSIQRRADLRNETWQVSGQWVLTGEPLTTTALKDKLQKLKSADPEFGVVVKGASEVDSQNMVTVLAILQQSEITKVGQAAEVTP